MDLALGKRNHYVVFAERSIDLHVDRVADRFAPAKGELPDEHVDFEIESAVAESDEEHGRLGLLDDRWNLARGLDQQSECQLCVGAVGDPDADDEPCLGVR